MYDDETLIDCIKASGYYECEDDGINIDDLPNDKRVAIILAGELLDLRPELKNPNSDVVYIKRVILENGDDTFSLPSKSLSTFLRDLPFVDSSIYTYSIKEEKLLKRIYKGTGTNWEKV
ncbi:hypothetical protein [Methanobrevibacter sp.]|uniref:hypothetical protein n=1 Tax=Methanobrevibacter sp. TaxID=66852 RepID=UPI00386C9F56